MTASKRGLTGQVTDFQLSDELGEFRDSVRAYARDHLVDNAASADAEARFPADAVRVGGAHIGSHSFTDGQGSGAGYNSQAQVWDALVRDADPVVPGNQQYAVLFSAGNLGFLGLTSPKAAENIITVGATED